MKIPKIHLNEKQSKTAVIILIILSSVSSIDTVCWYVHFGHFASIFASLGEIMKLATVVLFVLFILKLREHSQQPHRRFASIWVLFGSSCCIKSLTPIIWNIGAYRFSLDTNEWVQLFIYFIIAFFAIVTAIAVYKNKKKLQRISLPIIVSFAFLMFAYEVYELARANQLAYELFGIAKGYSWVIEIVLYYGVTLCMPLALNIYYNHNSLIPTKAIDPNAYAPAEALRLLKEQFDTGIIDEETHARLRGEALKKL